MPQKTGFIFFARSMIIYFRRKMYAFFAPAVFCEIWYFVAFCAKMFAILFLVFSCTAF